MNEILDLIKKFDKWDHYIFYFESDKIKSEYGSFFSYLKTLSSHKLDDFLSQMSDEEYSDIFKRKIKKSQILPSEKTRRLHDKIQNIINDIPNKKKKFSANTKKAIQFRKILKADWETFFNSFTDQNLSIDIPPIQKELLPTENLINLPEFDDSTIQEVNILNCMKKRKSRRKYTKEPLNQVELSFLLWATQGVIKKIDNNRLTKRTVPSGGARNPFETYLAIHNVQGLAPGIYRYQPLEHAIVHVFNVKNLKEKVIKAAYGNDFVGSGAVTFIWSVIPYRTEWRYTTESKKIILQETGHICQNLYLACESINAGTCAIGYYDQKRFDKLLKLDGNNEFTIYVAPVGKVEKEYDIIKLSEKETKKYCGTYYCTSENSKRQIDFKNNSLYYVVNDEIEYPLEAIGSTLFRFVEFEITIKFTLKNDTWTFLLIDGYDELSYERIK